ncbi:hypothetical protein K402DRAFT_401370 [Aulographum hederae CBS 113979]|uniref:Uncharacterized protein n=1 Tax=Aulographum hederae CBS 113979 TaxID=1176131 RepID=A0A6G1H9X2_9PEZI|nr:hypothetical protein K402DRAFT_401370 [Aulographum hederae CBS 113979]
MPHSLLISQITTNTIILLNNSPARVTDTAPGKPAPGGTPKLVVRAVDCFTGEVKTAFFRKVGSETVETVGEEEGGDRVVRKEVVRRVVEDGNGDADGGKMELEAAEGEERVLRIMKEVKVTKRVKEALVEGEDGKVVAVVLRWEALWTQEIVGRTFPSKRLGARPRNLVKVILSRRPRNTSRKRKTLRPFPVNERRWPQGITIRRFLNLLASRNIQLDLCICVDFAHTPGTLMENWKS